jgi:general secretion pathway protein C
MTYTVEQTRNIVSIVNKALVVAVALSGLIIARDMVQLVGTKAPETGPKATAKAGGKHRRPPLLSYAPILKNNVFGFDAGDLFPISSARASKVPETASPAQVSLSVLGAVAWDEGFGYAFIKGAKGQEVVKAGEDIPGSGRLERVYPDRIIVSYGGEEFEVMVLEVKGPATEEPGPQEPEAQTGSFARRTGSGKYVVDRIAVEDTISNPKRLMTDARMLPHYGKKGVQNGFKLSEVVAGGVYDTLGLKNDDIVLKVNGLALSNPESALQAFTAVRGSDRIVLDFIRGGKRKSLTYTLR